MRRQETALAKVCLVGAVAAFLGWGSLAVQAQDLKKYESNTKDFWLNPPADWFLGDETQAQKGQVPNPGQPTPTPKADLEKILQKVKLPQGFKIEVWAAGVPGPPDGAGRQGHAVRRHVRQGHRARCHRHG